MNTKKFIRAVRLVFITIIIVLLTVDTPAQTDAPANLPQFLFSAFIKSVVKMKTGESYSALFNYNIVEEEMIFNQKGVYMVLASPDDVDTIYLLNRKFVPVENAFYEVLINKPVSFFIQHKSKYTSVGTAIAYGLTSQTNAPTTATTMRSGNQIRTLEIPDNVKVVPAPVYWVRVNNEMKKCTSGRQFIKIFPEKEKELDQFIDKNHIDFKKAVDLIKLVNYCNEIYK